jgi:hypothetical protein
VKVGDLVMFRNCMQQGTMGIISVLSKPSHLAKANPKLRIYWVVCPDGEQCFTGNQLVLV